MTIAAVSDIPEFPATASLNTDPWRRFVLEHPQANIFHTPEMCEVFRRSHRHIPVVLAVLQRDSVLALLPLVRVSLGSGSGWPLTARYIAYGGLLRQDSIAGLQALKELVQFFVSKVGHAALFTEIREAHADPQAMEILSSVGFSSATVVNRQVALDQPPGQLFRGFSRHGRKAVRNAANKKLEVETVERKQDLGEWYSLIRSTYQRAHVPLADESLFEAAFDVLHQRSMVRFFLVRSKGKAVAASAELLFRDEIYGWYQGFNHGCRALRPNDLLMWEVLSWGCRNQFRSYDFGGVGPADESSGVSRFKAKFGGHLLRLYRHRFIHAPIRFAAARAGYFFLRRFIPM